MYKIFCAKDLLKTAYNNKWVINRVVAVVALVTAITVPIYIILGGGGSSKDTISEDTVELTRFFRQYQSTRWETAKLWRGNESQPHSYRYRRYISLLIAYGDIIATVETALSTSVYVIVKKSCFWRHWECMPSSSPQIFSWVSHCGQWMRSTAMHA